jgi:hypothetical protein
VSVASLPAHFDRERRRAQAIAKGLNGIDFVDVADDRRTLTVYFFLPAPAATGHRHYVVAGGSRVRNLKTIEVHHDGGDDPLQENCLRIRVDRPGDYSTYRFEVVDLPGFDPLFRSTPFTFGRAPGMALDCAMERSAPPAPPDAEPDLNYLVKDFDSFLTLILDRFALNVPAWTETHVPDIGITLAELLAYAADQISYHQDAIATEAYLDTARFRISARRHARLLDYKIQEGCNARAWVSVETDTDLDPFPASGVTFATAGAAAIFEPVDASGFRPLAALSRISFYTWGDTVRKLPAGATSATLSGVPAGTVKAGHVLVFEEVIGPATGSPLDADPAHRCVVRLTSVRKDVDPIDETPILEIAWGAEDRLPFDFTLSLRDARTGALVTDVSVARGNVVLADHGSTLATAEAIGTVPATGPFRPKLAQPNLTYRATPNHAGSATASTIQNPRRATPQIAALTSSSADRPDTSWTAVYDLLESGPNANAFVVEMDDDRYANVRFGDGFLGAAPEPGATFSARYRVGNGTAGNVGAETIVALKLPKETVAGAAITVRNPLPATGGTDPEPLAQIKLLAPQAYSTELARAVTAADYATIAERNPAVFQAAAVLRFSGARSTVRIAIDPLGTERVAGALLEAIAHELEHVRSIGQDVEVVGATYVPLDVELAVAVLPDYLRGDVATALHQVFSNRVLPDGTLGFFHQNNLGFGLAIYESALIRAAQGVEGVQTVDVLRLARLLDESQGPLPSGGALTLGPLEVAQLDNDPSAPERGRFELRMSGGR